MKLSYPSQVGWRRVVQKLSGMEWCSRNYPRWYEVKILNSSPRGKVFYAIIDRREREENDGGNEGKTLFSQRRKLICRAAGVKKTLFFFIIDYSTEKK